MTTQSFQWWITPTPQQTKHIPQVGWEHPTIPHSKAINHTKRVGWENPTTREQQDTDNTGEPNTINDTKFVGWEYPTKKLQIINHHYKRLKYA